MSSMLARGWQLYSVVILILIAAVAAIWWFTRSPEPAPTPAPVATEPTAEPAPITETVIGTSVEERDINAVTFGNGSTQLLFVGGMHGGYEWNSSLLAYEIIDYLTADPKRVPSGLSIAIIPDLNPDGTALVTGTTGRFTASDIANPDTRVAAGRFNANDVDLNRNFACKWAPESTWRGATVSAGDAAFSEPEARALRDFVNQNQPSAVIFWHSQANNVYASECEEGVLPETLTLMNTYATAGNYGAVPSFDAYPITGDAEGWLASIGIPAITVEMETFRSIEWERNLAGFEAVVESYSD